MNSAAESSGSLSPLKRAILELRELRARLEAAERAGSEPIAITGLGLRFPGGATSPEAFWELLRDGVDAIREIPSDRWDVEAYYDPDPASPGKMYTRAGGFLDHVDQFDPQFFGIAPREANTMDPQQRLLLEVSWEALEHAGQAPDKLAGSQTGVFFGICNNDYMRLQNQDICDIDVYFATGNLFSVAAGRLSYLLGLQGPSLAVDTACSSSLTAVHLACQSLRGGECDLALAGGVNLILSPEMNVDFSKAGMMAPDGRCKTFDRAADGYVRSEGCGVVVLKRLSDALAAGDPILAVIRGSAVNQDGRSSGLTAPNGLAQEAVIRRALANAHVEPHQVSYVEAHGTGTALGDPIELRALGAALGPGRAPDRPLLIGSVKTNIGHTEGAAGVAGLIKTVLALQHREIPAHLHLAVPTPHVPWDALPMVVPTQRTAWQPIDGRRIAGVSSFGFSGTNAHVILEEAPVRPPPCPEPERPVHTLTLSAKTPSALAALAQRYEQHLAAQPEQALGDVCFTANAGRAHFPERLAVAATSTEQLRERLRAAVSQDEAPGIVRGRASLAGPPEVAFLFTGQGAQRAGMAQRLYETQPTFRRALDRCADILGPLLDRPLLEVLFPAPSAKRSEPDVIAADMAYAQPAQFAVQYALAELWRSWGVEPILVAGHSLGEYAAACVAGVFSLEDGLKLVAARGRLLQSLPSAGAMAAVFAEEARVASALRPYNGAVAIAAVNGPQSVVVSGQAEAVRGVVADLGLTPEQWRRLDVPAASHSPLVEPVLDAFERAAADVTYQAPRIGLVSTLTGQLATGADLTTPGYWRRHLRQPVRFAQAIETLHAQGIDVFVEIGPHPTLLGMGRRCLGDDVGTWLPSLRHDWDDWEQISESLAHLYVRGVPVDWAGFDRDYPRRRVALPTYPFERQRYWAAPARRPVPAATTPAWDRAVAAARRQADQGPLALNLASYPEKWTCLNGLATAYVVRALRQLGVYGHPGEAHTPSELVAAHGINPGYEKLLLRWLEGLAAAGLLQRRPDGAFVGLAPLPDPDLPALERAAETALADVTPLLEYVRRCGEKLASILTGAETPLETLFPEGSYGTVEYLYRDWPVARYENAIAAAVVEAWTHAESRSLQVLEIGGGTGGTTHSLLPLLPAERTTYWFTDVSDFFLGRAQEQFRAYPFVRYGLLDVERDPSAQGYRPHSFDVVVAANVLHATRDLDATLEHVRWLLAPGGVLVLYEATTHPHWFDVTTALIEGWQRFADEWRSDNPLLGTDQWVRVLRAHGFEAVCAFPDAESPPAVFGQHVIVARGPLSVPDPTELTPAQRDEAARAVTRNGPPAQVDGCTAPVVASSAPAEELVARLRAALPDERQELVVDYVRGHVARVLRLADAGIIDPHHRLLDLGLDSLMAVDLRDRLSRGLALPRKLPATLVFDYPTVAVIAAYLERQVMDAQPSVPAAEVAATVSDGQATMPPTTQEAIADLSDEEVARLLMQKLERQ